MFGNMGVDLECQVLEVRENGGETDIPGGGKVVEIWWGGLTRYEGLPGDGGMGEEKGKTEAERADEVEAFNER